MAENDVKVKITLVDEMTGKANASMQKLSKSFDGAKESSKKAAKDLEQYNKNLKEIGLQSVGVSEKIGKLGATFIAAALAAKAVTSIIGYLKGAAQATMDASIAQYQLTGNISAGAKAIVGYNEEIEKTKLNIGQLVIDGGVLESWKKLELTITKIAENAVRGWTYLLGMSDTGKYSKMAGELSEVNIELEKLKHFKKALSEGNQAVPDSTISKITELEKQKIKLEKDMAALAKGYKPEGSENPMTASQLAAEKAKRDAAAKGKAGAKERTVESIFAGGAGPSQMNIDYAMKEAEAEIAAKEKVMEANRKSAEEERALMEEIANYRHEIHEEVLEQQKAQSEAKKRARQEEIANTFTAANATIGAVGMIAEAVKADAEAKKRIAQVSAVINTAQAVTKIWAEAGPLAPILIPAAIASGVAQIALIQQQQFAMGGKPRRGAALVGEREPEMVTFGGGERVHNGTEAKEMANSSPSNITVNITATSSAIVNDIRAMLRSGEGSALIRDINRTNRRG